VSPVELEELEPVAFVVTEAIVVLDVSGSGPLVVSKGAVELDPGLAVPEDDADSARGGRSLAVFYVT